MAVEMTASRVLAPHFGASFFVWTALIVTVLLSMSLGYWFGGRFATQAVSGLKPLGLLLCSSAILLLIGLWGSRDLAGSLPALLSNFGGAAAALFLGSLVMSVAVFALPVFILAMSSPLMMKLWSAEMSDVGGAAGRYFAVSTGGSVIGTLLPSLVLVPQFGVRITMMSIAGVLAILGLLVIRGKMRAVSLAILIVVFFALLIQGYDRPERVVYEKESPYQLIRVEEYGSDRYLIFNDGSGTQSVWFPTRQRTDMYYDHLAAVPLLLNETDQHWRTAVLGLAGGSLIRQYLTTYPKDLTPDIVGVEVDPSVIDTARRFFAIDELPIQIVNEDGRTFLARTQDPFDVIIIDAYSTQLYIPPHMVTEEFFSSVRDNLTVGGLTAMNVNAPQEDSALLQAITNTAASVFPFVYMTKAGSTWNWLVVASDQPLDYLSAASRLPENYGDVAESLLAVRRIMFDSGQQVLTDDRAPIELMTDKMIIADALRYMGER